MTAALGSGTARVRRTLKGIYLGTAALGALAFVGIEVLVLYQLGGQFLPYIPRSADEFAGYCMAASAFLALAYTLDANEHIRVTLVSDRVGPVTRRIIDRVAVSIAVVLAAFLGWHVTKMAWQTWLFDERSAGQIPLPLWIPQAAMAVGAIVFVVAVIQRAVRVWRGGGIELPMQGEGGHRADR
ncbi:MAG: TRAP transporter small permease [Burkholderiaceae bacterium]|nr:TRAP transporter small permease [Burkholderiaceae bacterium]